MRVTIFGTGYVGLVTGTCLAEVGNDVVCVDVDAAKIARLDRGEIPIYEPGLEPLVRANHASGRLQFTHRRGHCDRARAGRSSSPSARRRTRTAAPISRMCSTVARTIGRTLSRYAVVVNKSTVPVGTADSVRAAIAGELAVRGGRDRVRRRFQSGIPQGRRRGAGLPASRPHHRSAPTARARSRR